MVNINLTSLKLNLLLVSAMSVKEFDIINTDKYIDNDGQIVRRAKAWNRVTKYFNTLNSNLKGFVLGEQIPGKKKDW